MIQIGIIWLEAQSKLVKMIYLLEERYKLTTMQV